MPATTIVSSATLDNVPGATGAAQNGHLIYATNTGRWWFFTWQGKQDSGTCTSGSSASQVQDTTKSWTSGQWLGMTCFITSGTGSGQCFIIGTNTSNTLPVVDDAGLSSLGTAPDTTSHYEIVDSSKVHAWVSSSGDLSSATWSEATGSPAPTLKDSSNGLGRGINVAGGSINSGGSGQFPTDGRLLHVSYGNVSGTDVVMLVAQQDSHYTQVTMRGRITAATTVSWDGVVSGTTDNWDDTAPGADGPPEFPEGVSVGFSNTGRWWHIYDQNGRVACGYAAGVTDNGNANQAQAWAGNNGSSAPTSFDTGIGSGDMCASALMPLASGFMLAVYCQGNTNTPASNGNATQTGLRYTESASATQWPTTSTGAAVPNLSSTSNDPNDWGIVARTTTDIHVVRRNGSTALEQIRYSGHNGSWGSKVNLPSTGLTGHLAGSGVALVSDGTSVWCFVIDTDANHSIRYIKWTGGSWDNSWSTLSTDTTVKNFITAYRSSTQTGVAWTTGSSSPFSVEIAVLADATTPFKNPVSYMVLNGAGGKRPRARVGWWHTTADSVKSRLVSSGELPQVNIAQAMIQSGYKGRASRWRNPSFIFSSNETKTVYQDNAVSFSKDRSNRKVIPKFLNFDNPIANGIINLFLPPVPPHKLIANFMVAVGIGGRRARGRSGYWHVIADQANPSLWDGPQPNNAEVLVAAGIPGRRAARRRSNQFPAGAYVSQTIYQDLVIGSSRDRASRTSVPKFKNNELSAANFFAGFVQYIFPPTKQIAQYFVQAGIAGRRARGRVGFWHTIADSVNASLSGVTEMVQANIAQNMIQSGIRGRASRRRDPRFILTYDETKTSYQGPVISVAKDINNRRTVPIFKNLDRPVSTFLLTTLQPFKQLASFMVQVGVGGRRAIRRVGYWHTIADSVNTNVVFSNEAIQTNISHSPVIAGRSGRRTSRTGQWYSTSNETKTAFSDQMIVVPGRRVGSNRPVGKFFNWDKIASSFLNTLGGPAVHAVNMSVATIMKVGVAPGLFRELVFKRPIIVQARAFTLQLLNKINKI